MSERSSFTSEYIYDSATYLAVRERLESFGGGKYLCVSAAPTYELDGRRFDLPVISGKIGALAMNTEWMELEDVLQGLVTASPVRFVIMCDGGAIQLVTKRPNGEVFTEALGPIPG